MFKLNYTSKTNSKNETCYSSCACVVNAEQKEQYNLELVRISNKFFKTNFCSFAEWGATAKYDIVSDMLLQLTYHYDVTIDGIYSDQWSRLDATLNSFAKAEDQIKVEICFGSCLLDAIVHLYNYLEIFRKEYVEEELKD
jgi:hypothetical protein